ncbi:hypothetical protein Vadar_024219 [Vaccinium darrowii]|uniref:Uncharacterized protein n=1 Tax=Vaccinium darrowii TaxID=229202 RepID=A0ACB7ZLI5_9ERIC|nr:hypothetical protein Vadar_024219 [Vaccinium darrowii]
MVFDSHFPVLSNPSSFIASSLVSSLPVLATRLVDGSGPNPSAIVAPGGSVKKISDRLERITVENKDHLIIDESDGTTACQIKTLNAEIQLLRKKLEAKSAGGGARQQVWVAKPVVEEVELGSSIVPVGDIGDTGLVFSPIVIPKEGADPLSAIDEGKNGGVEEKDWEAEVEDLLSDVPEVPVPVPVAKKGRGREAKLRIENLPTIVKHCFPSHWSVLHNATPNTAARIVIAWDAQTLQVSLTHSSSQLIVVKVLSQDQRLFYVSFVYGQNLMVERKNLWVAMKTLFPIIGDVPWIQLGDFNVVRRMSERLDGFDTNAATEFNECLDYIGMDDMPFKGFWFTWSNKRGGLGNVKSKLDRVLINGSWLDSFPESETIFLAPGPAWSILCSKLQRLKPVLRAFNKRFFSQIGERVLQARQELTHVQEQCFQSPFDGALADMEKELYLKFIDLSQAEEAFKKQKSRVQWLALGDQNTRFFHFKLKSRCLRNKILSLTNASGVRLTEPQAVKEEILGYYIGLLGSPFEQRRSAYQVLRLAVNQRVSVDMKYHIAQSDAFVVHPKCRHLQITHLIFADDLFVLCGVDEGSFHLIADALSDFYLFSGLKPNMQKSSIFFAGVTAATKELLGNQEKKLGGTPPVRLGDDAKTWIWHAYFADCVKIYYRSISSHPYPFPYPYQKKFLRLKTLPDVKHIFSPKFYSDLGDASVSYAAEIGLRCWVLVCIGSKLTPYPNMLHRRIDQLARRHYTTSARWNFMHECSAH